MDVRRARRVKIGLAGLAVLGIGAALTSAAWTTWSSSTPTSPPETSTSRARCPPSQTAPVIPGAADRLGGVRRHHRDHAELRLGPGRARGSADGADGIRPQRPGEHVDGGRDRDRARPHVDPARRDHRRRGVHARSPPAGSRLPATATFTLTVTAGPTAVEGATGRIIVRVDGVSDDPVRALMSPVRRGHAVLGSPARPHHGGAALVVVLAATLIAALPGAAMPARAADRDAATGTWP